MAWQQPARIGMAVVGLVSAGLVVATLRPRETPAPAPPPDRIDPAAVIETAGADLQQLSGVRRDYRIEAGRHLTYADGTTRFLEVEVLVEDREGRDFRMRGREARVAPGAIELEMEGGVVLEASDGFTVEAEHAVFSDETGLVRTDDPVAFASAALRGTGTGMRYDTGSDLLRLDADSDVTLTAAEGDAVHFTAGASTFDRPAGSLALEGGARIERKDEILEARTVAVTLDAAGERPTFIALRGDARMVAPDGALDDLRARDLDLAYSDDGLTLERVALRGAAAARLAPAAGAAARTLRGDTIDAMFAADGAVDTLAAAGGAVLELPAGEGPARRVAAERITTASTAGDLSGATFAGQVVFEEAAVLPRRVEADRLEVGFAQGAVARAVFDGDVRFAEGALTATGGRVDYAPAAGTLELTDPDGGGAPHVEDARIAVDGGRIAVDLAPFGLSASGGVRAVLAGGDEARMPALLNGRAQVNVSAATLDYQGTRTPTIFAGGVVLWQGEVSIRAARVALDQGTGDFEATGAAESTVLLDGVPSRGAAPRIRYDDARRALLYEPIGTGVGEPAASLEAPPGDVRAARIAVTLTPAAGGVARLEAEGAVALALEARSATGDSLVYESADESYVLRGLPDAPAVLLDACRRTEGRTLRFVAGGEQVIVDGAADTRTRAEERGTCQPEAAQ